MSSSSKIAVIIPAYKVRSHLKNILARITNEISYIFVVDDHCPEKSYEIAEEVKLQDPRIVVIKHTQNQGVGGAMISGYTAALNTDAVAIVKIDGDGQMPPELITSFTAPILSGKADYVKGNRFYIADFLKDMPKIRLFGNASLSFINKISSGYWNVMDPTNGFTVIHKKVLTLIPLDKVDKGYFFESDMLFQLGILRAVVKDIPMKSIYGQEKSSLNIKKVLKDFPPKYLDRIIKRITYSYFVRDFNACSIELVCGLPLLMFGGFFGAYKWLQHIQSQTTASAGTVMLAGLPVLVGFNLIIAAINFDVTQVPKDPINPYIED